MKPRVLTCLGCMWHRQLVLTPDSRVVIVDCDAPPDAKRPRCCPKPKRPQGQE